MLIICKNFGDFLDFYIITLGCKVNQYESEMMSELLLSNGFSKAEGYSDADICIINSCTVTSTGDSKCRKVIHRVRRENKDAVIILTGCMPQAYADNLSAFDECDIVLGNTCRGEIITTIFDYLNTCSQIIRITPHEKGERFEPMQISNFSERTRAYMKIEDGCNRFCTYCIIPYARGRVRSKPLDIIKKEAHDLAKAGFREIVIVGINLSAYGEDIDADIYEAVHAVCEIDGIDRVRLGSIEPERMTEEILLKLKGEEKFCPHFHLSLQSGCDETLKRMKRHYDTSEYRQIVENIREIFDNPSVTTDVMVGFVGETEEEFNQSLDFCDEIGFAKVHVFPYSMRKGTRAETMDGHIPEHEKNRRSKIMIEHTDIKEQQFLSSQVGTDQPVLFETKSADGYFEGYTKNYTKVKVRSEKDISNQILDVRITAAYNDYCLGELL